MKDLELPHCPYLLPWNVPTLISIRGPPRTAIDVHFMSSGPSAGSPESTPNPKDLITQN